jgi:hypothetical protein
MRRHVLAATLIALGLLGPSESHAQTTPLLPCENDLNLSASMRELCRGARLAADDLERVLVAPATFDAATDLGSPEATANRNDFLKLLGFLVSPETFTDEGKGTVGITYNPLFVPDKRLSLAISAREPALREQVTEALSDDEEKALLQELDLRDDVLYEARLRLVPSKIGGVAGLLSSYFLDASGFRDDARIQDIATITDPIQNLLRSTLRTLSGQRTELERQRDALPVDDPARASLEQRINDIGPQIDVVAVQIKERFESSTSGGVSTFLAEQERALADELNLINLGVQNRPQVHVTGRHREAHESIAPREQGAGVTVQWGLPTLKKQDESKLVTWVNDNAARLPHSFAAEIAYDEKDEVELRGNPALFQDAIAEVKASFNWTTKMFRKGLTVNGVKVGADQSLTVSYLSPDSDTLDDRFIINETIVFHLTENISVPISLIYANRKELIDADEVIGRVGFSFSFRNKATE